MKSLALPLAVFTAGHGLGWSAPKGEIHEGELETVRRMFGRGPDFDCGESGFGGVAMHGGRVFVARCAKAEKWDFRGRDSLYFAMTWMDAEAFADVDLEALLSNPFLREPMRNPPSVFAFGKGTEEKGASRPFEGLEEGSAFRRNDGEGDFTQTARKEPEDMTKAEELLFGTEDGKKGPDSSGAAPGGDGGTPGANGNGWFRILAVIVFIALILPATYFAKMSAHPFAGYVIGAIAFSAAGKLWSLGGRK